MKQIQPADVGDFSLCFSVIERLTITLNDRESYGIFFESLDNLERVYLISIE
ncbi:hypothetical protein Mar181_1020 [Marinomonas posidonica IVIA-Po-181]|uniref:Uncharacterized protein n=1 Tax=Marinomonas posidonica (strain CECT 7376 / NCIMB 14433 / IVIA-Po-181) TaxID=491952 RepID=F6CU17_MARPP|nr:hypothetical protein Mar181_1020 [Marinomonas posidonica IVIA-Po-181]